MIDLEQLCMDYFDGKVKPKDLILFNEVTPNGNVIEGYINRKPNRYLGSLLITEVNNEKALQFIQSMPKIHYYNDKSDISECEKVTGLCYEKLDGSCLIIYPLRNSNGDVIEIIPKTRGRAVADKHFISLYNKLDKKPIMKYYEDGNTGILIFEMYGILNQHDIIHYDTGIDIRLISIIEDGEFINNQIDYETFTLTNVARYNFRLPDKLFDMFYHDNEWHIKATSDKYFTYLQNVIQSYPTLDDCISGVMDLLENLNKEYYEINGRLAIEGVVLNTVNCKGSKKFIKIKPRDILLKHRSENGIPRRSISKEVLKYFDEYGSDVEKIYNENPNHHTEYIHRMLEEEYPIELIHKSKNKIEKVFMQVWESKQVPMSIHTLCSDLIADNPNRSIQELMRIFSKEYPMKKRDARLVYSVLEKQLKRKEQMGDN